VVIILLIQRDILKLMQNCHLFLIIEHFKNFYRQIIQSKYIGKDDPFIVELGCNDGILLKNFSKTLLIFDLT
jgi:hypothetical protein